MAFNQAKETEPLEVPLKRNTQPLKFSPSLIIRAHSKNDDPSDILTQVIQCKLEPNPEIRFHYKSDVATCGGNTVCITDTNNGDINMKYTRSNRLSSADGIYSIAWTTLDNKNGRRMNILAAGGGKSTVLLIHPEGEVCYDMIVTNNKKGCVVLPIISSLLFHPLRPRLLFCGHQDGQIQLWDIGIPSLPDYEGNSKHLITINGFGEDVLNMEFCKGMKLLLAGCENGLFAWKIDNYTDKEDLTCCEIRFPRKVKEPTVDSICLVRDDIIAAKYAGQGEIVLFSLSINLPNTFKSSDNNPQIISLIAPDILTLRWCLNEDSYINMGADSESCTLVCGDDEGKIWVYDLYNEVSGEISTPLNCGPQVSRKTPSAIIQLPEIYDSEADKARKIQLKNNEIIIERVTITKGGGKIIAVTSNNLICIWVRK